MNKKLNNYNNNIWHFFLLKDKNVINENLKQILIEKIGQFNENRNNNSLFINKS